MPHQLSKGRMDHGCFLYQAKDSHEILVIAAGKFDGWNKTNTVELYRIGSDEGWIPGPTLPLSSVRGYTFTPGAQLHFYALKRDGNQLMMYDQETNEWHEKSLQTGPNGFVPIISWNIIALDINDLGNFCNKI